MNLGDFKTALKRYGFDDSDPLAIWINAAKNDFETANRWPWAVNSNTQTFSAANTAVITLTDSWHTVLYVNVTAPSEKSLAYLSPEEFELLDDTQTADIPTYWTTQLAGSLNGVRFWPKTNATSVTIKTVYTYVGADLVNPTDVPALVPTSAHWAIVERAASIALTAENEEQRASVAQASYEASLQRAMEYYTPRRTMTVKDAAGYYC